MKGVMLLAGAVALFSPNGFAEWGSYYVLGLVVDALYLFRSQANREEHIFPKTMRC